MPPKIKVTEEEMMMAALEIVRRTGLESLNARELASELNCSVHPIFRAYESMEGLKRAVYKEAENCYNKVMVQALNEPKNGFLSMGLAYIDFAKSEKNLFKLLFMSDTFQSVSIMDIVGMTEGDDEVIELLCRQTGLNEKSAKELYAGIWLTTHGIASMFATNNCRFSEEENRTFLQNSFQGLVMQLQKKEKELNK